MLCANADGSITVKIRLDDVAVDRDVRWAAASIALTNITGDSPLQVGSKGAIHRHNNNAVYIQRKTYTGKAYIYGSQIYAGNNVMPLNKPGDVVVKNGSHVIWDAMNGVHLEPGVRVEAGGALEVR